MAPASILLLPDSMSASKKADRAKHSEFREGARRTLDTSQPRAEKQRP